MKSLREKAVLAAVGVVLLYAVAVATWFLSAEKSWAKAAKRYGDAQRKFQREETLIGQTRQWTDDYEAEKAAMPTFDFGKSTDTTWLGKMDAIAAKHRVQITQRQGGKEIEEGEVLELPIEVRNWEGSLEALVRFLHELENTDEGMFDMRALNFKPSSKKGYLKGSFTLTCAYMRKP